MKKGILKNTGKTAAVILLFMALSGVLFASEVETSLDSSRISVGESTILRLKISGNSDDIKPVKVASLPGLDISYMGMQTSFQYINGKTWRGVTLTFSVTAGKKGKYTIPAFEFDIHGRKVRSSPVSLIVIKGISGAGRPSSSGASSGIWSEVAFSDSRIYAGEPVFLRYYLLTTGSDSIRIRGMEKQPQTKGFVIRKIEESIDDEIISKNGEDYIRSHVMSFVLVPAESGKLRAGGGNMILSFESGRGFFSHEISKRISFAVKDIEVLPLPKEGQPEGFTGNVGQFTVKAEFDPAGINVYDEKKITVTVSGTGNIVTVNRPVPVSEPEGVKILAEDGQGTIGSGEGKVNGEKKFMYTLIPEKSGRVETGGFMLIFFNPETGKYEKNGTGEVSFDVKGTSGSNMKRVEFDKNTEVSDSIAFNPLYIGIILIIIGSGIGLFVIWERRRYNLVINGGAPEKEEDQVRENKPGYSDHLNSSRKAMRQGNITQFLSSADAALTDALKNADRKDVTDAKKSEIEKVRNLVHGYKFGGANLTQVEMEKIYSQIEKFDI